MALGRRIAYVMAMTQPHRPVGPGDHVFLIDGSSFVFRAYYQSIRQDQKYNYRTDRLPTGAVRLFATKVLQFIRDGAAGFKPTHLAIIFDKTENSFRREIYPAYKAHRKDPPDELVPQFPLMRATVSAFGMVPIEQGRYEADDIIATYARQAREAGADVLIVSADKDLMQLVEPCVSMYDPASGQAGVAGLARSGASASRKWSNISRESGPTRSSTSRRSPAIRPTMCPARLASGSRPRRSSFSNMATSRRCSPARARSSSRSGAKRSPTPKSSSAS